MSILRRLKRKPRVQKALPLPERFYGGDHTIHGGTALDVEVDRFGNVVAVWFRCKPLQFKQSTANSARERDMKAMYAAGNIEGLDAVVVHR